MEEPTESRRVPQVEVITWEEKATGQEFDEAIDDLLADAPNSYGRGGPTQHFEGKIEVGSTTITVVRHEEHYAAENIRHEVSIVTEIVGADVSGTEQLDFRSSGHGLEVHAKTRMSGTPRFSGSYQDLPLSEYTAGGFYLCRCKPWVAISWRRL